MCYMHINMQSWEQHPYKSRMTLIPAWKSNNMSGKVWDEITYPFPNFSDHKKWNLGIDK